MVLRSSFTNCFDEVRGVAVVPDFPYDHFHFFGTSCREVFDAEEVVRADRVKRGDSECYFRGGPHLVV